MYVGPNKGLVQRKDIFVISSLINEQLLSTKNKPIQIQICDFQQMFDGMNLKEALSDLFDSGGNDDHLALIHEADNKIGIQVKTPYGLTVEQTLKENILQGDTLSSIISSNQVDTIGKTLLKENPDHLFQYKD